MTFILYFGMVHHSHDTGCKEGKGQAAVRTGGE